MKTLDELKADYLIFMNNDHPTLQDYDFWMKTFDTMTNKQLAEFTQIWKDSYRGAI